MEKSEVKHCGAGDNNISKKCNFSFYSAYYKIYNNKSGGNEMKAREESETMDIDLHKPSEEKLSLVSGGNEPDRLHIGLFIPTPHPPASEINPSN